MLTGRKIIHFDDVVSDILILVLDPLQILLEFWDFDHFSSQLEFS